MIYITDFFYHYIAFNNDLICYILPVAFVFPDPFVLISFGLFKYLRQFYLNHPLDFYSFFHDLPLIVLYTKIYK